MSQSNNNAAIPFFVAVMGIATFSAMDVLMKSLSLEMGVYNAMLWRTLTATLIATVLFVGTKQTRPDGLVLKLHVRRGVLTSIMAFLFFWGLMFVPLAEAIALTFIAPLIALYLAAALLGEKINGRAIIASVVGLAGALVVIAGKLGSNFSEQAGYGIAAIVFSAVLYAYNLILQRQQALVANPIEIALFQNGIVFTLYALFAPFWAVVPSTDQLPALSGAAILGIGSLMLLSWAYGRAEAKILIPVEYTAFIWMSLFGWFIYKEAVTPATLVGTAMIVTGCLVAAYQRTGPVDHVETTAI
jgi:S-adenosylmethionine uptake transporter